LRIDGGLDGRRHCGHGVEVDIDSGDRGSDGNVLMPPMVAVVTALPSAPSAPASVSLAQ